MVHHAAQAVEGDAIAATPTYLPRGPRDSSTDKTSWPQPVIGTFDFDPDGDFDTSLPAWEDAWPFQSTGSLASMMSSVQDLTPSTLSMPAWSFSTPTWQAAFSSALPSATWLSEWPFSQDLASSTTSAISLVSTPTSASSTLDAATSTSQASLSTVSSTTSPTGAQSTSSVPSSPASTAALPASHSPASHHLSLSRGAIVAIAAGSALVLLLLIVFLALTLCCSRRRRRERNTANSNGDGVYINHTWRSDQASTSDASHNDAAWRESVTPYTLGGGGATRDAQPSESAPFDHYSYPRQPTSQQQPGMTYASTPPRQVTAGPLSQRQQASASIPPIRNLTAFADAAALGGQGDRESPARASSSLTMSGTGAAWTTRAMHTRGGQGHNVSGSTLASTSGTGGGGSYSSSLLDVTKGDVQVKTASPVEAAGRAHAVPAALFKRCSGRPEITPTTALQQAGAPGTMTSTAPIRPLTLAIQQGDRQTQPQAQTPTSARHDPRARLRYLSSISSSSPTTPSARSSDQSFTCADAQTLPPYRLTATPPQPRRELRSERDDAGGGDDASVYSDRSWTGGRGGWAGRM